MYWNSIKKVPNFPLLESIRNQIPLQTLKELLRTDGEQPFRFPTPQVIKGMVYVSKQLFSVQNR